MVGRSTRGTPSLVPVCPVPAPNPPNRSSPASSEIFSSWVSAPSRIPARASGDRRVSHQGWAPQRPTAGADGGAVRPNSASSARARASRRVRRPGSAGSARREPRQPSAAAFPGPIAPPQVIRTRRTDDTRCRPYVATLLLPCRRALRRGTGYLAGQPAAWPASALCPAPRWRGALRRRARVTCAEQDGERRGRADRGAARGPSAHPG